MDAFDILVDSLVLPRIVLPSTFVYTYMCTFRILKDKPHSSCPDKLYMFRDDGDCFDHRALPRKSGSLIVSNIVKM